MIKPRKYSMVLQLHSSHYRADSQAKKIYNGELNRDRTAGECFGLKVKVMPHALKGLDCVYDHPEKRAEDLNNALRDDSVKGIICAIGNNETVRILPFVDTDA